MRLIVAIFVSAAVSNACLGAEPIAAYPRSPVIANMDWAPVATIIRRAKDGDNWPVKWADDDALYTTWGDGTDFPPRVVKKLSCGFARITGSAAEFKGENAPEP
jgi:hypothetical protein